MVVQIWGHSRASYDREQKNASVPRGAFCSMAIAGNSNEWEPPLCVPKLSFPSLPVRDPQGTIRLYTKGADTVILERLQRRGPNETFTEMALDVSPMPAWGGKGWSPCYWLWPGCPGVPRCSFSLWLQDFGPSSFCSRSLTCIWDRG